MSNMVINILKQASENLTYKDARKIWKRFYSVNNFKSKYRCGNNCVFIDECGEPVRFTFFDGCMMQGRVIRYLYKQGFRINVATNKVSCNKRIYQLLSDYAHKACQPERLSENDYFNISLILE